MWNEEQVAELTAETAAGSVQWSRASNGALTTERQGQALKLERADDGRHTLTVSGAGLAFTVLAESMNPDMGDALMALWDAAFPSSE